MYFPHIKYNGDIIGCIKIGFKNVYIKDYKKIIEFPPKIAFIYDTYIVPEFRGLNLASFMINEVSCFLRNKEYRAVLCHIPHWNTPSIKAYSKVGFKRLKSIRWIKILGFDFLTTNPSTLLIQ